MSPLANLVVLHGEERGGVAGEEPVAGGVGCLEGGGVELWGWGKTISKGRAITLPHVVFE